MEIRASYVIVGAVVLALLAALAAFSVWLVKADSDRQFTQYEVAFNGSVSGLQPGGQVRYRGIPVGQVAELKIDPDNVGQVLALLEIQEGTPVRQDTFASLEMQGVTGIAYVQLRGGTQASPPLAIPDDGTLPRIASRESTLERVFDSTPDLLARAVGLADRLALFLDDENLSALRQTLANTEKFTAGLAASSGRIDQALGTTIETATELKALATDMRDVTHRLDQRTSGLGGELVSTLDDLRGAATALDGAARQLDGMVADMRDPLRDFGDTGLYEFTNLVGESRELVSALTRITKEFERDPTGFFIGGQKGYEAK
jgi:phospholipid/cholesterol/gamma-HCH transport system substrate-binding protein